MIISRSVLLRMRNISDKNFVDKIKSIIFMFNKFFQKNRVVYEIMWESTVQPDSPQMTI